jgi:hypothetical protein
VSGARPGAGAAFTADDVAQLEARGIPVAEAERQLALLAKAGHHRRIDRPCTIGDGILRLDEGARARHTAAGAAALAAGRCSRFVPASGAASRMFAELERLGAAAPPADPGGLDAAAAAGDADARALRTFLASARRLALWDGIAAHVARGGGDAARLLEARDWRPLLDALLDERGMGATALPKGLLPFHREAGEVRTAFDEQLAEAAALIAGRDGVARAHFTVSGAHRAGFEAALEAARGRTPSVRFDVTFSEQHPSTDTLAADPAGGLFRQDDGSLLFRPAGHGALIENLNALGADIVLIKNIDNVVPDRLKEPTYEWSRVLAGLLAGVEAGARDCADRLETEGRTDDLEDAQEFMAVHFGWRARAGAGDRRAVLLAALRRPIRVCGMVKNTGEPGGGPYFVAGGDRGPQIVESAEVDMSDPGQARVFREATHFNPVFMACALRDPGGQPYDLRRFVDPSAVIVTRKSAQGRPLLALERPGLWNGAMAHWNSIFVEAPGEVFNPVKTVFDLLRPEHQPA